LHTPQVFGVLTIQLVLTLAVCSYTVFNVAANTFILSNPGLAILGMILSIVLLIALLCFRKSHPTNIILLVACESPCHVTCTTTHGDAGGAAEASSGVEIQRVHHTGTLVEAYTVGTVTAAYARAGEGEAVVLAVGLTAVCFVSLSVFTLQVRDQAFPPSHAHPRDSRGP
jgi:FtsH-binding integral membrane protein